MEYQAITEKIKELVKPLLDEKGIELVEMTYRQEGKRMVLRFFVDKAGGITLDECADLNEQIGASLDKDDTIASSYILEVSSPGLDRPIVTKEDFRRVLDKKVEVFLKTPLGDKYSYVGELNEVKEDSIILKHQTQSVEIPLDIVNNGRLKIDFGK